MVVRDDGTPVTREWVADKLDRFASGIGREPSVIAFTASQFADIKRHCGGPPAALLDGLIVLSVDSPVFYLG